MIATIEHVWRRLRQRPLVPFAMLVIGVRIPADPARRSTGYGGVLPVPTSSAPATSVARSEQPIDQSRRDVRAARGRVLYAAGHAPQATAQRAERKAACTDRRVGQSKSPSTSPNS
jgi:hypothetical protein